MIKFALVGCGRIAQRHAEHINNNGKLVAVCDIVKSKADELALKYNAKAYYAIDEMLQNEKEIDHRYFNHGGLCHWVRSRRCCATPPRRILAQGAQNRIISLPGWQSHPQLHR